MTQSLSLDPRHLFVALHSTLGYSLRGFYVLVRLLASTSSYYFTIDTSLMTLTSNNRVGASRVITAG